MQAELLHILEWSGKNKLIVNTAKTKEIVFHRPRLPTKLMPPLMPDIDRVDHAKILGVFFTCTLSPQQHVNHLLNQCNQRLFLLSQLKQQSLPFEALNTIFISLILCKITYALPAFAGHISTADKNRINKFFKKAHRRELVKQVFTIETLIDKFDLQLFRSISYTDHCLHHLLPEKRHHSMQLRPRGHNYTLSNISTTLFRNAFVNRCLFDIV